MPVRPILSLLPLIALQGLTGCGGSDVQAVTPAGDPRPASGSASSGGGGGRELAVVKCKVSYRGNVVAAQDERLLDISSGSDLEGVRFADLSWFARILPSNGGDHPSFYIRVDRTAGSTAQSILSVLYQYDPAATPRNQFTGGQGFTGLHSVEHPTSGSQLRFYCSVP